MDGRYNRPMDISGARVLLLRPSEVEGAEASSRLEALARSVEALGCDMVALPEESALVELEGARVDVVLFVLNSTEAELFVSRAKELCDIGAFVAVLPELTTEAIISAVKLGADHCIHLATDVNGLSVVLSRAVEKPALARAAEQARDEAHLRLSVGHFAQIVGAHPIMQDLLDRVLQVASSRATVLLTGETGTGKELIAGALHEHSRRSNGPYVRLNCAALSPTVLESELFGHERGAFTGAITRRKGRFEAAHGGSLFLDEVSELPPGVQVKLLRFLQEREFERVGGNDTIRVDVRVIAATNRNLKALVEDGRFREDLFYRLNVIRLDVPPLRARPSDIPLLADHFARAYAEDEGRNPPPFSKEAARAMLTYPWPGNVRELQNAVAQAVVLCRGEQVDVSDLPFGHEDDAGGVEPVRLLIPGITLAELERFAILRTLDAVSGSTTKAAKILGVSRRTVQYRLAEWGLSRRAKD